jgi:HAD superfamily phosphoserine phosphatase-like hydrolase
MLGSQFSPEIRAQLSALMDTTGLAPQPIAVFDADGTLWDGDASEALLQWAEARGHIQAPQGATDIMSHYLELVDADRVHGFGWAAQIFAGHVIEQVHEWAEQSFRELVLPHIIDEMSWLIDQFHNQHWQVWIVSASPRFAVLPGCRRLGIEANRLLSVELQTRDGRYTSQLAGLVTSGHGKVTRMREAMNERPTFVAGNSIDDVPLMAEATALAMVVNPSELHSPGTDLTQVAQQRGWLIHRTGRR